MAASVSSSFDFDGELRRIALAQALRPLNPAQLGHRLHRILAYAQAGLCVVDDADDRDAVRRHQARPVNTIGASLDQVAGPASLLGIVSVPARNA